LTIYPDSSFLVSLYLVDRHSPEAWRRSLQHLSMLVTPFHRAEFTHAIYHHVFRGKMSVAEAQLALKNFELDSTTGSWVKVSVPETAFETCGVLAQRHVPTLGSRTLDSLHVACALELRAQRFWTFDERQARLAEAVGLSTAP
jgi:predicted nucleic acid-binding protein